MGDQHHTLGDRVATGNTSDVWQYSPTTVVKVLRPGIPRHWATLEAEITSSVHAAGLPVPMTEGVVEVDGRPGIVFERIEGASMWERMKASPSDLPSLAGNLVDLQVELHAAISVDGLPDLTARLRSKMGDAEQLSPAERREALDLLGHLLADLPSASALCHGDVHPANILMSPRGMIIVDWFDAANGQPVADYARSSLLMRPSASAMSGKSHLDGASNGFVKRLHAAYLAALVKRGLMQEPPFAAWEAVLAVARLAEPVPSADLIATWRSWRAQPEAASRSTRRDA